MLCDAHGKAKQKWGVKRIHSRYAYDPLGRRLSKQVETNTGWITEDGWRESLEEAMRMQPPQTIATDPAWLDPAHNLIELQGKKEDQQEAQAEGMAAAAKGTPETIRYLWSGNQLFTEYHSPGPNELRVIHHISEVDSFVPIAQVIDEYRQGIPETTAPFPDRTQLKGLEPEPRHRSDNPEKDWLTQLRADAPKSSLGNPLPLDHRWVQLARAEEKVLQDEVWKKLEAQDKATEIRTRVYHIHTDHLGTPQEMTSEDARLVWAIHLTAWGRTRAIQMPEATEEEKATLSQHFRFQGQQFDPETGLSRLHHCRYTVLSVTQRDDTCAMNVPTADEQLAAALECDLLTRYGPMVSGDVLRLVLGYASKEAFRQALSRQTVPVPVFTLPNRRGKFALVKDIAAWLAAQRARAVLGRESGNQTSGYMPRTEKGDPR